MDGKDCKVNKDVERVLKDFHKAGKPIGYVLLAQEQAWWAGGASGAWQWRGRTVGWAGAVAGNSRMGAATLNCGLDNSASLPVLTGGFMGAFQP